MLVKLPSKRKVKVFRPSSRTFRGCPSHGQSDVPLEIRCCNSKLVVAKAEREKRRGKVVLIRAHQALLVLRALPYDKQSGPDH